MILCEATETGPLTPTIREHFAELTDSRRREPVYPLMDIVVMDLCAVICGADDFVAIAQWADSPKTVSVTVYECVARHSVARPV